MERTRESRKLLVAVLISLFFHLLIGFSLAAFGSAFTPALPAVDEKPVELTIVDSSQPAPEKPKDAPFIETAPSKESAEKPKEQTFESNANSIGASENPATGNMPVPEQNGKDRPFMDLETHKYSLANNGSQPQPDSESTTRQEAEPSNKPDPKMTQPTPAAKPKPIATPEPEQLALLKATPPPPSKLEPDVETSPPPAVIESVPRSLPRPKPKTAPASSYLAEKEKTRIVGNLDNRGPASVNAVGTPLGRYTKTVVDAVGSRWHYYIKAKGEVASIGTTAIHAEVDAQGHWQNMQVLSNTANEAFANICLQSFQEAHIPPIPPELIETLSNGRVSIDINFAYYSN
jgi:outer membrane biosynthesis protein TonB